MNPKYANRITAAVSASGKNVEPVVELMSFKLAGPSRARLVLDVTHTSESRAKPELVRAAIRTKLRGKMTPVLKTFSRVSTSKFTDRYVGMSTVVKEVIPVTKNNLAAFKSISSNMFMDGEQEMWVLRNTDSGQLLVKSTGIDDEDTLTELLQGVSSVQSYTIAGDANKLIAQCSAISEKVAGGDFVSYVDANDAVNYGYVVATVHASENAIILSISSDEPETVNLYAITAVHSTAGFPEIHLLEDEQFGLVIANARGFDLDQVLEYYKKVYQRSPAFYAQFAERLRNHEFFC